MDRIKSAKQNLSVRSVLYRPSVRFVRPSERPTWNYPHIFNHFYDRHIPISIGQPSHPKSFISYVCMSFPAATLNLFLYCFFVFILFLVCVFFYVCVCFLSVYFFTWKGWKGIYLKGFGDPSFKIFLGFPFASAEYFYSDEKKRNYASYTIISSNKKI